MNNSNQNPHSRLQRSTTLNRKYVKRPTPRIRTSAEIQEENLKRRQALAKRMGQKHLLATKETKSPSKVQVNPEKTVEKIKRHPLEISARNRLRKLPENHSEKLTLKERKEQAIEKALKSMKSLPDKVEKKKLHKSFLSTKRVALALFSAIFVIGVAIYFINLSMPNISVKVAAMKSGIDAIYPSFVPKGFSLAKVESGDNLISMIFKSSPDSSFILTEEKSSWNSSALETNYIKPLYKNNYSTIREQGLTIFISDSNCAWINGGKLFTISSTAKLSKDQLVSIATSL